MIKSITADTKTGTVTYEYCQMHNEYPNDCNGCPYLTPSNYCRAWQVKHDD